MPVENFKVVLEPFVVQEQIGNLTVTKSLNQDRVIIVTADGDRRHWGYVPTIEGQGQFLPLAKFPAELVPEVQRQINELRGTSFDAPEMMDDEEIALNEDEDQEEWE